MPKKTTNRSKALMAGVRRSVALGRRLPLLPAATAVSALVLVLGVIGIVKPTLVRAPRSVTSAVRTQDVAGVSVPTQSVTTTRFARIGMQWVLQRERQELVVRGNGLPESNVVAPLAFAEPGTFVTDADARRFRVPGLYYAYQGRSDGASVVLESRTELNLSVWWIVGVFGVLPAIWLARTGIRIRNARSIGKP
ncbi:hypothetical protein [Humisphaera borealis]|uniref:Uncharacterized protein n=1 Tax=Humisphaera borealis TaxID=2807512 RepID=A0A7M2X294_9BACT|nr:hypothetical protein [Humisphaera borealis]QOV91729.1 hypothetical protein IPV69_10365 [Humisphaera borealis]